ncbi:short chain dehydrogenase [Lophiotrema nucula]|uniref:Short chain dehydrogenase n=1 Tax=Lophiotrema nucula TaxID=690887 RepID=A0A6A5ZNE4_9PLEO|nr:short chain dehydrogenase [Lophiotrema nucula]
MSSDKRIILITGGNNGIGYDTVAALSSADANNHIILAARSEERGLKALEELKARKPAGTISFVKLDVTDDSSIAAAAAQVEKEFGRLDVLVNNAGIAITKPTDREVFRQTFETNVYGPALLTDALAPLLKKSKDPRIINVSSGLGSIAKRADPKDDYYSTAADPYRMSKAALNMLTTCQSYNYKDDGFKVWTYCPGFVITDLTGKDHRKWREENGADSSETSAQGILEIVEGKRDGEVNCFVQRYGKQFPW